MGKAGQGLAAQAWHGNADKKVELKGDATEEKSERRLTAIEHFDERKFNGKEKCNHRDHRAIS
jgi:hypothetical protein